MPKKILVVAESIDVEDSSGSKANVALIRNLNRIGYDLKVYHYTRKDLKLGGIKCISIKEKRHSLLFFLSRTERYLRNHLNIKLNKPLEKLFGFSFTLLNDRNSIVRALLDLENWEPDLVLTLSKGGSFRPHHAVLQIPVLHKRWIAYIHDPYPMHFYPPPYPWFEAGYLQKEKFMKEVAMKATVTAFPSKMLMEWMGKHYEPFHAKGVVIPHQLEESTEITDALPAFIDPGNFNLVHAGNFLQGRDPNGLVSAFKKFLEDNPDAKNKARLILLGGLNYYSEKLSEYGKILPELIVSGRTLPFNTVQKIQKESSVNIILEAKSEISPFLPGKFPHCINASRIILLLGPPKSESRRLLGENYEYWAEIDDVQGIANLIGNLYHLWKREPERLSLERPDLEKYLSTDHLKEVMKSVLEKNREENLRKNVLER